MPGGSIVPGRGETRCCMYPPFIMRQTARMPVAVIEQLQSVLWRDSILNDDFDGGLQTDRH